MAAADGLTGTTIVVPMLDEAAALPALIPVLAALDPPPVEILAVDGGSGDASVALARAAGWRVIACAPGRGRQVNAGVAAATGAQVCVLHADTLPPRDLVVVIDRVLADRRTALAGFVPIIRGARLRWATTAHNIAKTWYAPLLLRPHLFARGVRLLFGDHAMFFRRADFLAVDGCDPALAVMEEADLCIRLAARGRVRLIARTVTTSDRRIAAWGPVRANWIYFKVGMLWAVGARARLGTHYPHVR